MIDNPAMEPDDVEESAVQALTADDITRIGAKWITRLEQAKKREKDWIDDAESAETAYLARDSEDRASVGDVPAFNILHSNVETIVPSIYNSTPVPDIRPRHSGTDKTAKTVSQIFEAAIRVCIDDNRLDAEVEKMAQDAFMAGRGALRVKFDADLVEVPPGIDPQTGMMTPPQQIVQNERILFEVIPWADYRQGPARRWSDVPWVAFRHCLGHEDVERLKDPDIAAMFADDAKKDDKEEAKEDDDTPVWEIWDKASGRVFFVAADNSRVLSIKDDPMGLAGFFPMGEPILPISATNSLVPVCPYTIYKALAEELDGATRRINAIMKGLKVRGLIAGDASVLETIKNLDDNDLAPVENLEGLVAAGGLQNAVMWWPVEQSIAVLQQLYQQREVTKQAIYEITGISDIIRGQSSASETATAQQIKTQWGALRIKKMQRLIERQVRDIFVLCADIISQHFSILTLQKMTGIEIDAAAAQLLQSPLDNYRINVESDSTVRADLTRGRQEMSAFLQGTSQFFGTMAPIAQQSPAAMASIVEIYSAFARQFNIGKQAEDALDRMVEMAQQAAENPKPPQPDPQVEAAKADMALKQQDMQTRAQLDQQKMGIEAQRLELDKAKLALDARNTHVDNVVKQGQAAGQLVEQVSGAAPVITDMVGQVVQGILGPIMAAVQAGNAVIAQEVQTGNAVLAQAINAPKELIRDAAGRPVGVRPMMQGRVN